MKLPDTLSIRTSGKGDEQTWHIKIGGKYRSCGVEYEKVPYFQKKCGDDWITLRRKI